MAILGAVTLRSVNGYLSDVDKQRREERKQRIFDLWLAGYSQDEIATAIEEKKDTVSDVLKVCRNLEGLPNSDKLTANFTDSDWTPPLFNVWTFAKKSNEVGHFGNLP